MKGSECESSGLSVWYLPFIPPAEVVRVQGAPRCDVTVTTSQQPPL